MTTDPTLARLEAEALSAANGLGVPPCPHVLAEIVRELRCEVPNVQRIAELITHDAASSVVIVQTANSALDGLSSKARSIHQANEYVGANRASYLIGGLLLRNAFSNSNKRAALTAFWDTCTELAVCAAYIAGELGTVDRDEAHTYGLLRDIGSAVLACKHDDYDDAIFRRRMDSTRNIAVAEQERFGTDHTQIGAQLADGWQLPKEMKDAILWHHADNVLDRGARPLADEPLRLIAIGALCDRIVAEYEDTEPDNVLIQSTAKALRVLDLSMPRFEALQDEAAALLDQIGINAMPTIRVHRLNEGRRSDE